MNEMNHCTVCGEKLIMKELKNEGMIPYCPKCGEYRFPVFSCAVSMIVMNEKKDKILLIKQYSRDHYILTAGYVNKGEDGEEAVKREVREELGVEVKSLRFNHSRFFAPSNTLMWNFTVTIDEDIHPNEEIDSYEWFSIEEARDHVKKCSLAEAFLLGYLDGEYHFPSKEVR